MTRSSVRRLPAAFAAMAALALVGTAAATVLDSAQYAGSESWVDEGCGTGYAVDSTWSGRYTMRLGTDGEAFPEKVNYEYRDVWRNTDTGKWFVIRGNGMWHDIKARQIGDSTVYRFTQVDAGQPMVIENMNGRVVSRDRGSIRVDYLWDTLGDGAPGGAFVDLAGVRVNGPHPAYADDFPFCDLASVLTKA